MDHAEQGLKVVSRSYRKGEVSLGVMAEQLGMSLSEVIDLLAELGVRSPIEYDDYLKSYRVASELFAHLKE